MNREDFAPWVETAVRDLGGSASHEQVAEHIWNNHETDLKAAGRVFYRWQYEARWAADLLRKRGVLQTVDVAGRGNLILKR